jgi:hypothetical protein
VRDFLFVDGDLDVDRGEARLDVVELMEDRDAV